MHTHDRTLDRRGFLAVCGAAGLGGCVAPSSTAGSDDRPADTDWSSFGRDLGNTWSVGAVSGPRGALTTRWALSTGGYDVHAPPTVRDGAVYFGSGRTLYRLDLRDGDEEWRRGTPREADRYTPAVGDDAVYASLVDDGVGLLCAYDAASGDERWHVDLDVRSSAAVVDDRIYVGGSVDGDAAVFAFDRQGRRRWVTPVGEGEAVRETPAFRDGVLFVPGRCDRSGDTRACIHALDAATGTVLWETAVGGGRATAAAVADGAVYVGDTAGVVTCLDANDGTPRWDAEMDAQVRTAPAADGDAVYVGTVESEVYALGRTDGTTRWRQDTAVVSNPLAVTRDAVYAGDGEVVVLDRDHGAVIGGYDLDGAYSTAYTAPVVAGETVLVGGCIKHQPGDRYDNYLFALTADDR